MKKTNKIIVIIGVLIVGVLGGMGAFAYKMYSDVTNVTDKIHNEVSTEKKREEKVKVSREDPFSIALLGIDTGDFGRVDQGRSDSVTVLTVNPKTKQTKILSVPRDTYTEISGFNKKDKIAHAYAFGGIETALNTLQNLLDIPIDYYISIDMGAAEKIIDAIGGVDVNSPLAFELDGIAFKKGPAHLNGEEALAYTRMRYDDPKGDYGRQARQREVLENIIKEGATLSSLMKYKDVLTVIEDNMKTNLSIDEMFEIQKNYRSAADTIEQVQLVGEGEMLNDVSYEMIPQDEIERVSTILKKELDI
ncbi:LCP family protein [Carnobacterium maltaromaticum]|uniref:LCP family glycopolymer transferase n=1 Tax=Carnobacterium maltaromaticum TaxID=2751 RepID=UPI0012F837CE|nr:LCP family protein [Carnobacterium maltaromaticum]